MRTIHKHNLQLMNEQTLALPLGFAPLCVQAQDGRLALWVMGSTEAPTVDTKVFVVGTGNDAAHVSGHVEYVGTAQISGFVWHVFL